MRGKIGNEGNPKMKYIKHLFFTFVIVLGVTAAVSAQKNDQKQRPPKSGNPPVVTPAENKNRPKENPPKNEGGKGNRGRGNRPGLAAVIPSGQITSELL